MGQLKYGFTLRKGNFSNTHRKLPKILAIFVFVVVVVVVSGIQSC